MRICIIQKLLPFHSTGGAEFMGWHTALGLYRLGHQVTVVTISDANYKGEHVINGVQIIFLETVTPWSPNFNKTFAKEAFDNYLRSHETQFDVVQVRGWRIAALVGGSCTVNPLRIPVSGHTAGLGFFYEFETRARTIREEHEGNRLQKLKAMLAKKKNYLIYALPKERKVRHLDAFTTVTTRGLRFAHYLYGISKRKLHLVNDGISVERFFPSSAATPVSNIVLYVGALVRRKGVHLLIQAMKSVIKKQPDAVLRIVGDGPELENLQTLTQEIGIEKHVMFTGRLEHAKIPGEMQSCKVFVNPTNSTVGYETVQIEAMLCEKLVVTPNTASNRMILVHKETGFLFHQGNACSLANTIVTALRLEKGSQGEIVAKARQIAIENFSVVKMAEMNELVFQKMITDCRSSEADAL
jgi:glycosyltransferase involved in cell wall biosynthesis